MRLLRKLLLFPLRMLQLVLLFVFALVICAAFASLAGVIVLLVGLVIVSFCLFVLLLAPDLTGSNWVDEIAEKFPGDKGEQA
ncbi:hypothetical protein [Labrenzia sp. DG1229]|uniref:hypothetical protein n=1 Tax=Labrenzia sp. DG1229 TaxID=681847 RepID=UPI00048E6065|nr:hypothetical protein [Labrenzia sp. DG1229]